MPADWPDPVEIGDSLTSHAAHSWPCFAIRAGERPKYVSRRNTGSRDRLNHFETKLLSMNSAVSITGVDSRG